MFLIYIYNFEHGLWSWLMIQVKVQIKLSLNSPNKRYKDNFKNSLINCRIDQDHWAEVASDRDLWRQSVHRAVTSFEENRIQASKEKRRKRKEHAATPTDTAKNTVYVCSNCNRACLSQIGLFSHKRKCTAQ